jgi:hypothetical protein
MAMTVKWRVGPMDELIALVGVILRAVDVAIKVLAFLKGKAEKSRNHPQ